VRLPSQYGSSPAGKGKLTHACESLYVFEGGVLGKMGFVFRA